MKQYKALVTSIGGDLGQAVCKALCRSNYNIKIFGTDCRNYEPHPLFCNLFQTIPKAKDSTYPEFINRFITENSIDLVYVCSEQELLYISDHFLEIDEEIRPRIVMPSPGIINICRDKLKTVQFLKNNYFPYPHSILYNSSVSVDMLLKGFNYPFIVKKLSSSGSKDFYMVRDILDFKSIKDLDSSYMLQEYITGLEYTNGVYRDPFNNETYVITLERTLKDGVSSEVKVVFDKDIEELCKSVARILNLSGSINIQLRKQKDSAPVIFEINPRYSSTAFIRSNFGFNDVIYAFENIILKKAIDKPNIKSGKAFRYLEEYYKFD
ncbi:ATP-grasp domain-containing protein [Clostridium sp. CX1]|uniref:ATP-grasp domain-containing protein n=1 Tax=Clostridium sp. CX1 TaxID=2978346 RepID=UPI0021C13E88|nr:ATP-grasp domain-containing protein [Clostridium sp. CX1]MCT8977411.1 ATP-grasp domain-containing protein [Clostridium sp. CX1]